MSASDAFMTAVADHDEVIRLDAEAQGIEEDENFPKTILDTVPYLTPEYEKPVHLAPIIEHLEKVLTKRVWIAFHVPTQHGKTTLVQHAIAYWMKNNPRLRIAYATYNQDQANLKATETQELIERAGIKSDGRTMGKRNWRTEQGGLLMHRGRGAGLSGQPVDIGVIDDLFKDRKEAGSPVIRESAWDYTVDVFMNRFHARSSFILFFTRWHDDDVIGRIIKNMLDRFVVIRIPALADHLNLTGKKAAADPVGRKKGEALLDRVKTKKELEKLRDNPATEESFWSLQQGLPKGSKNAIFQNVYYYDPKDLPTSGYMLIWSMDGAYSKKTTADESVLLKARYVPKWVDIEVEGEEEPQKEDQGILYLEFMMSDRCGSDVWNKNVLPLVGNQKVYWRGSGVEKGVADLFTFNCEFTAVTTDKRINNEPAAKMWNEHRILCPNPEGIPTSWLDTFLEQIWGFTGQGEKDDYVDTLGNAVAAITNLAEPKGESWS